MFKDDKRAVIVDQGVIESPVLETNLSYYCSADKDCPPHKPTCDGTSCTGNMHNQLDSQNCAYDWKQRFSVHRKV